MQKQRRSKKGFHQFLAQQPHRSDKVGMLARDVAAPRHWLSRLISGGPDQQELKHATAVAMFEYDRSLGSTR
jgi:hypothetical protein